MCRCFGPGRACVETRAWLRIRLEEVEGFSCVGFAKKGNDARSTPYENIDVAVHLFSGE